MKIFFLVVFFFISLISCFGSDKLLLHTPGFNEPVQSLNVLFIPLEHYGRYKSGLGIAVELSKRGHNVTMATTSTSMKWFNEDKELLDKHNIVHYIYSDIDADIRKSQKKGEYSTENALLSFVDHNTRIGTEQTLKLIEHCDEKAESIKNFQHNPRSISKHPYYDMILADIGSLGGINLAMYYDIPGVYYSTLPLSTDAGRAPLYLGTMGTGFGLIKNIQNRLINLYVKYFFLTTLKSAFRDPLIELDKKLGIHEKKQMMTDENIPILQVLPTGLDYAFAYPPTNFNVGVTRIFDRDTLPSIPEDILDWFNQDKENEFNIMYISLGTTAIPDLKKFNFIADTYDLLNKHEFKILKELKLRIIWALPVKSEETLHDIIDDLADSSFFFKSVKWVPQTTILASEYVQFSHIHGGANSLVETASFGVPCVCSSIFIDQKDNCQRVEDLELGVQYNFEETTIEEAKQLLRKLIYDEKYKYNINNIGRLIELMEGAKRSADIIEIISQVGSKIFEDQFYKLPFYQKYYLDIYLIITGLISTAVLIIYFIFKFIFKCCYKSKKQKSE